MATLVENAAEVANLASAIDTAITTKGGTLVGGGKLRNAAAGIASIQTGSTATPLTVTANGTYTAPTGSAYSPVTVEVTGSGYTGTSTIIVWDAGLARSKTLSLGQPQVAVTIDWGDGTVENWGSWTNPTHTYANYDVYTITLTGGNKFKGNSAVSDVYFGSTSARVIDSYTGVSNAMIHDNVNLSVSPNVNITCFARNSIATLGSSYSGNVSTIANVNATLCTSFGINSRWGIVRAKKIDFGSNIVTLTAYAFCGGNGNSLLWVRAGGFIQNNGGAYCFLDYKGARLPDSIDLSGSTSGNDDMFSGCTGLVQIPNNMKSNYSISFAPCTGILVADSVATFDANGDIDGGFVYNLNTCTNADQTITFNSTIQALFDSTQQAAIESALTAKNWTVAW